jgi:hypothetical protein
MMKVFLKKICQRAWVVVLFFSILGHAPLQTLESQTPKPELFPQHELYLTSPKGTFQLKDCSELTMLNLMSVLFFDPATKKINLDQMKSKLLSNSKKTKDQSKQMYLFFENLNAMNSSQWDKDELHMQWSQINRSLFDDDCSKNVFDQWFSYFHVSSGKFATVEQMGSELKKLFPTFSFHFLSKDLLEIKTPSWGDYVLLVDGHRSEVMLILPNDNDNPTCPSSPCHVVPSLENYTKIMNKMNDQ